VGGGVWAAGRGCSRRASLTVPVWVYDSTRIQESSQQRQQQQRQLLHTAAAWVAASGYIPAEENWCMWCTCTGAGGGSWGAVCPQALGCWARVGSVRGGACREEEGMGAGPWVGVGAGDAAASMLTPGMEVGTCTEEGAAQHTHTHRGPRQGTTAGDTDSCASRGKEAQRQMRCCCWDSYCRLYTAHLA
jgi:hypothetical protein